MLLASSSNLVQTNLQEDTIIAPQKPFQKRPAGTGVAGPRVGAGNTAENNQGANNGVDRNRAAKKNDQPFYRINDQIRVPEVRLVGENVEQGVYPIEKAKQIADEQELDLIEISPTAVPPVCRIADYQKFLYQQKKREKEQKAKQKKVEVKEIRFGPQTGDNDYAFKLKHAEEFLKEGNKVKAYVFFKGRSILFKDQGEEILGRFMADLEELAKVDQQPLLEGKRLSIMLSPKKAK